MRLAQIARMAHLTKSPAAEVVTPLDVIFSCSVCNATFRETYDGHDKTVHGLSDGLNPNDHLVTRMYLTSCCHVVCSKHFDGGGPAFHPAGARPSAPCPICSEEKGENTARELYSIRGFKKGEYDDAIPPCWFVTPPIRLDSTGKEMEALKFQYVSLIRYTKHVTMGYTQMKERLLDEQQTARKFETMISQEHAKVIKLEQEVERTRSNDAELQKLKIRMPAIEHYLKLIPKLVEQNDQMRQRLASLGFQMPLEPLSCKEPFPLDGFGNIVEDPARQVLEPHYSTASSHTVGTPVNLRHDVESDPVSSSPHVRPLKRQRLDSPLPEHKYYTPLPQKRRNDSRDMMPPPSKPLSRMRSMKKFWPTLRKRNEQQPSVTAGQLSRNNDVYMHNSGSPTLTNPCNDPRDGSSRVPTHPRFQAGEPPYMTGAIPIEDLPHLKGSPQALLLPGAEVGKSRAQILCRSPIQQTPRPLPSEPSYMRIMDGISQDTGLELRLKDPREGLLGHPRPRQPDGSNNGALGAIDHYHNNIKSTRRDLKDSFLHRPSNGSLTAIYRHPDPLGSNPSRHNDSHSAMNCYRDPITPAAQRLQQPKQAESVVSPFFKSSNYESQLFSRVGVAEQDRSSTRLEAYRYQRHPTPTVQRNWHEPRSLNGLSFFDSPLNRRNELIQVPQSTPRRHFATQEQYDAARNLDCQGFITRPNPGHTPLMTDYAHDFHHRSSQRRAVHPRSPIPFPSVTRSTAHLPSTDSSMASRQSSRAQNSLSHLEALLRVGVRSSHAPGKYKSKIKNISPAKIPRFSTGKWSIRR